MCLDRVLCSLHDLLTSSQQHLLISLLLARVVLFAHHQDRTVCVPYHRVRDAANEGSLDAAQPPASQHYQSCTDVLPYSEDPLVWSSHPEVGSRNGSPASSTRFTCSSSKRCPICLISSSCA